MIVDYAVGEPALAESPTERSWRDSWRAFDAGPSLLIGLLIVVSASITTYDYSYRVTAQHDAGMFALFWFAQALMVLPVAARLLGSRAIRAERYALVIAFALAETLPKFLRSPSGPVFHDELIHSAQADAVYSSGHLLLSNTLQPVVGQFPGLETLSTAFRQLSGLSTYTTALIIISTVHVATALGVWQIVEQTTARMSNSLKNIDLGTSGTDLQRISSVGAFLFCLNPAFMFFDSQYSYESLGIGFFVWGVACGVSVASKAHDRAVQIRWFGAGLLVTGACIVTHHVSSYILVLALILLAGCVWLSNERRGVDQRRTVLLLGIMALSGAGVAALWGVLFAPDVLTYLSPHIAGGATGVVSIASGHNQTRHLFQASTVPVYERWAAFAAPILLFGGVLAYIVQARRCAFRRNAGPRVALAVFAFTYFASLPFMLTSESEGARRSWAFSWVGLVVFIAPALCWLVCSHSGALRILTKTALCASALVVLIASVTVQVNVSYRYPGPYIYGSDARSVTPEVEAAATWLLSEVGPGAKVVAARDDALAFGTTGEADVAVPSSGFPLWDLYFIPGRLPVGLVRDLVSSRFDYLIVDRRMAQSLPEVGAYFVAGEPSYLDSAPPSPKALTKFDSVSWSARVYASENVRIYKLDLKVLAACTTNSRPATNCWGD